MESKGKNVFLVGFRKQRAVFYQIKGLFTRALSGDGWSSMTKKSVLRSSEFYVAFSPEGASFELDFA